MQLHASQAICIPFVGIAGNMINRIWLIALGTVLWGSMSAGLGFSANYAEVPPPPSACLSDAHHAMCNL